MTSVVRNSRFARWLSATFIAAAFPMAAHAVVINYTFDSSFAGSGANGAAMEAAFGQAAAFIEANYSNPSSINLVVGYGSIDGSAMGSSSLGESLAYLYQSGYAKVRNALQTLGTPGSGSLPQTGPSDLFATTAEAKALGLIPNSTATDGYLGFSSTYVFDYTPSNGITVGSYDFFGVALHEITEAMGRLSLKDSNFPYPSVMDMYRYSSASGDYFSLNGGATPLAYFNGISGYDLGDWASSVGPNAFDAVNSSGHLLPFDPVDRQLVGALGYVSTTQSVPEPSELPLFAIGLITLLALLQRARAERGRRQL
ncbi:NF038122 family metalloprotease [Dyella sp. A6]|uniref:NF038122 family metalloprotease n=1 Tax=Dyella aluminiiresistens TaxID=3069105 RepID=UPI002E7A379C|nr:NF038122 family metalloprotease [Dyella sp. A6]